MRRFADAKLKRRGWKTQKMLPTKKEGGCKYGRKELQILGNPTERENNANIISGPGYRRLLGHCAVVVEKSTTVEIFFVKLVA